MSLNTQSPYHDDFDADKNFQQILFVPGNPVQARELTGTQSILKHQISTHARHTFKEGTPIIGGQLTNNRITFVVLSDTFGTFPVVLEEWEGKKVIELTTADEPTGFEGKVVKIKETAGQKLIFIDSKIKFTAGNIVKIDGEEVRATIVESGNCQFLGIDSGIYFINSEAINVVKQSIILEDKNANPTGVAGLVWSEKIVTAAEDPSLFDPARGTSNYGAVGADRRAVETELVFVPDGQDAPENFVGVYEIREGETKSVNNVTKYSDLAKELARRTYDESGNYTVNPFALVLEDGINNKIKSISTAGVVETVLTHEVLVGDTLELSSRNASIDGLVTVTEIIDNKNFRIDKSPVAVLNGPGMTYKDEAEFSIELGKGKAYVRGFEIDKISSTNIAINRARDKQRVDNYNVVPVLGNYLVVKSATGFLDTSANTLVTFRDATNAVVGTASAVFFRLHSGDKALGTAKYRIYLTNFVFQTGKSLSTAKTLESASGFKADVDAESIDLAGNTFLVSSANSSLLYEIPQPGVATLMQGGVSSTSYTSHQMFSAAATGSNVSFSIGAGTDAQFYGPSGANFVGSDIERLLYTFVDQATGNYLTVATIEIVGAGKQLNVTFASTAGTVRALVPVQNSQTMPKTKVKSVHSSTITADTFTLANPSVTLTIWDGLRLISVKAGQEDYTNRFNFDGGQRDTSYDRAILSLKPGQTIPSGVALQIEIEYYAHSGSGYFSVDSYSDNYADIPTYTSKASGKTLNLSDVLDFRTAPSGNRIPIPNVPISADYEFYLPRKDAVVLYWNGVFGVIEGRSEINPVYPKIPDDAMVLYYLDVPAYTKRGQDCQTRYVDNKRYTMRDIGRLEKRINRLEYYTALSLLEFDTKNQSVKDENGFERFKNGFLVDSFTGHGIGNVNNADYKCAVDPSNNILRPAFNSSNVKLHVSGRLNVQSNDRYKEKVGEVITLPYTEEVFLWNNIASKSESVTPFLVTDTVGFLAANPPSDDWVDTTKAPAVMVNLEGDLDAWEAMTSAINGMAPGFGTQWGSWQDTWTGSSTNTSTTNFRGGGSSTTTTTTTTTDQIRTGSETTLGTERIEASTGEYVTDVNLAYFMREIEILITGEGLRANRDFHVFIDDININDLVTPEAGFAPFREGVAKSNADGEVKLKIKIPGGRFRTGERLVTVIDDIQGNRDNATSYGTYIFTASGLQTTIRESIISTRVPTVDVKTVTDSRTVTSTSSRTTTNFPPVTSSREQGEGGGRGDGDPLAQTFFVSAEAYPYGIFVTSATLYLRNKPVENIPLQVQLRTVTNGYPDSSNIIPFSNVFVSRDNVKLPTNTADLASILNAGTDIHFEAPIYLEPGKEYALVTLSSSTEYEAYIAVMGQTIFGTNIVINSQISLGSMFKSQNSSTWTAFQNEDLMMKINKAVFPVDTPGKITFNATHEKDVYISQFNHNIEPINFSNITNISSTYSIKNSSNLVQEAPIGYDLKKETIPNSEKVIFANTDFVSELTLTTAFKDVSPFVDTTRNSLVTVHNQINNLGLLDTGFAIVNGGTGYSEATTEVVIDGDGFGAEAKAIIENGIVAGITLTKPGENYTKVNSVTITGPGVGAQASYVGFETDAHGGNALARYITRNIVLAEGMETDFVTVTMDINKRFGTNILVYYRAKSPEDSEIIESKPWVKMQQQYDREVISGNAEEFTEVTYVPETTTIEYQSNGYTYTKANVIAIKVVMLSNDTSVVPMVKKFRAITTAT